MGSCRDTVHAEIFVVLNFLLLKLCQGVKFSRIQFRIVHLHHVVRVEGLCIYPMDFWPLL